DPACQRAGPSHARPDIDYTSSPIALPAGTQNFQSQTNGGVTYTFIPPGPDYRLLAVFISDGIATVNITPPVGANNEHFRVIPSQPGWAKTAGTASGDTRAWGVAVDGAGNSYVAGEISNGVDFGGGALSAAGFDIFVVKYDAAGTYQWSKGFGSPGADEARAITCDNAENSYITGFYSGSINFGGGVRPMLGLNDAFVLKLDPSGAWVWDVEWGSGNDDRGWGIGINAGGTEVGLTGFHAGAINFGGGSRAGNCRYLVRLNAGSGGYVWDAPWVGVPQGTNIFGDCEYDSIGNLYVTGHFPGMVDFGGGIRTSLGTDDIFLVKFNNAGAFVWDREFGGSDTEVGQSMCVDHADNPIVAGKSFGAVTYMSGFAPDDHQYVVKYNSAGTVQWDYFYNGTGSNWGVAVDPTNNVYFTGGVIGSPNFGGGARNSGGGFMPELVKLNSSGIYQWDAIFAVGGGVNYAFGLAAASDGSFRLAGNFTGTKDFDPGAAVYNQTAPGSGYAMYNCRINGTG
ncbi:MAG: hypothetical protein ABI743_15370, partial [bacterium]